jgi:hypothetical protein
MLRSGHGVKYGRLTVIESHSLLDFFLFQSISKKLIFRDSNKLIIQFSDK